MNDLETRMKENYEKRAQTQLPRRSNVIIRLDGKAFHTFTKSFDKPFDRRVVAAFKHAMFRMCNEIQGAKFGYTQSDEISILLTDYDTDRTAAWFDYKVQKMASVAASMCTAFFNEEMVRQKYGGPPALFDARVFSIPDPIEVHNYFVWRQKDATRNSIQALAQSLFSHNEMKSVGTNGLQDMMMEEHGVNWNDLPTMFKRGYCAYQEPVESLAGKDGEPRLRWVVDDEMPILTQYPNFVLQFMPLKYEITVHKACKAESTCKAVSFDYDDTLDRPEVLEYAKELTERGHIIYIITSRPSDQENEISGVGLGRNADIWETCEVLGIPRWRVVFTAHEDKVKAVRRIGTVFHLEDSLEEIEKITEYCKTCTPVYVEKSDWKERCEEVLTKTK
jgi:tRNA(His) 5'-end guanylyltransferase